MSQTKHRSIKTDSNSYLDEMEQAMHIKAHRAKKKSADYAVVDDKDDWDLDDDLAADVEYFLRKNR